MNSTIRCLLVLGSVIAIGACSNDDSDSSSGSNLPRIPNMLGKHKQEECPSISGTFRSTKSDAELTFWQQIDNTIVIETDKGKFLNVNGIVGKDGAESMVAWCEDGTIYGIGNDKDNSSILEKLAIKVVGENLNIDFVQSQVGTEKVLKYDSIPFERVK